MQVGLLSIPCKKKVGLNSFFYIYLIMYMNPLS
jgi:hypothetical protein